MVKYPFFGGFCSLRLAKVMFTFAVILGMIDNKSNQCKSSQIAKEGRKAGAKVRPQADLIFTGRETVWYVIQVTACREMDMVHRCRQILREGEEVFTMLTERMERRDGKWQPHTFVTFQKYIFVDTDDPEGFKIRLHSIDGLTKMLARHYFVKE